MENNPILNSPYHEPRWHYATDLQGNLNYEDIRKDRRVFDPNLGGYSMPVMRQKQGSLLEVNEFATEYGTHLINLLRQEVGRWRKAEYPDTTGATRDLLRYWFLNPERHATRSLFFAQREAIETAIWLNEVASKSNAGNNILNKLKEAQETTDDSPLPRICTKMATGTGKTLEELPEVQSYFKNAYSDFQIPYVADGKDRHYKPDFIIRCRTKDGRTLMLILEITGANKQYKTEKKLYTETYWIPAVNAVAVISDTKQSGSTSSGSRCA